MAGMMTDLREGRQRRDERGAALLAVLLLVAVMAIVAAMMLDHLGESRVARAIEEAVDRVLESGPRTPDLGGRATTQEFADAVAAKIQELFSA